MKDEYQFSDYWSWRNKAVCHLKVHREDCFLEKQNKYFIKNKHKGHCLKKLNIFCAIANWNWEEPNLIQSLKDMGHEVIWYDWKKEGYDQYSEDWVPVKKKEMNEKLLKKVSTAHKEKPVDLFFGYLSDPVIEKEYIEKISSLGIPTLNFSCNDIFGFTRGHIRTAPSFDLTWTTNKQAIPNYEGVGAKYIVTPYGVNPNVYSQSIEKEFSYDVSFVGQPYGYRLPLFVQLINSGFSYALLGKVSYEKFVETVLTSNVVLGCSGLGNADFTDTVHKQLRLRDFEIPAIGGLHLVERQDFILDYFEEDKEIICYSSIEELIDKVKFYSSSLNIDKRNKIAKAGQKRCLSEYTWEQIFNRVFQELGVL